MELLIPDLSPVPSRVIAYSWGVSQSGTTHVGGGAGAGKANFQDISLTKFLDHLSVPVVTKVATGAILSHAIMNFYDVSGGGRMLIGSYRFDNLIVSSVSTGGGAGAAITEFTENVSLNFAKISSQWNVDGTTFSYCFDIAANQVC